MCHGAGLHSESFGPLDGLPLVCIHGFGGSLEVMRNCLEPIASSHPRVSSMRRIYVDLPGHGRSPSPEWCDSSDKMLSLLDEFIEAVLGDRPFVLAGESYGGYLALGLLSLRKERVCGLHLLCPLMVASRNKRRREPKTVVYEDEAFLASTQGREFEDFMATAVIADASRFASFRESVAPGHRMVDMSLVRRVDGAYELSDDPLDSAVVVGYDRPALVCCGRQDSVVGWRDQEELAASMPRCTFALVDAAGHYLEIDQPELYRAHVSAWLGAVMRD